jgi:hypothetical protein
MCALVNSTRSKHPHKLTYTLYCQTGTESDAKYLGDVITSGMNTLEHLIRLTLYKTKHPNKTESLLRPQLEYCSQCGVTYTKDRDGLRMMQLPSKDSKLEQASYDTGRKFLKKKKWI